MIYISFLNDIFHKFATFKLQVGVTFLRRIKNLLEYRISVPWYTSNPAELFPYEVTHWNEQWKD